MSNRSVNKFNVNSTLLLGLELKKKGCFQQCSAISLLICWLDLVSVVVSNEEKELPNYSLDIKI
jgi:hypothetical protein